MKKEKEKKNRKKDKENGSSGGEAGNHNDIDAPDAVVMLCDKTKLTKLNGLFSRFFNVIFIVAGW